MPLELPDYRQREEWDCGRTTLQIVCGYWDKPLPLFLANLSNAVQGLSPDAMEAAFRSLGFNVFAGSLTVDLLRAITKDGKPVATLTQLDGVGHWVVVSGVNRGFVHFQCPQYGPSKQRVAEWDRNWIDFHWLGGRFDRWGICAYLED